MKIFNFLKKLRKKKEIEEIPIEKLTFSEIEIWIERKIKENKVQKKEILLEVHEKIRDINNELREKIIILEDFNVNAKKETDKIKNIVIDSRKKYVESVEDLINKLNNLEEAKLEKFIERINKIFFDFNKSSFKNYERATILIGKEMVSIKESLKIFSKNLLRIFDGSKPILDSFKNLLIIKGKLNTINPVDEILKKINLKKLNLNENIKEKEEEIKVLEQYLKKIKISQAHLENLDKQKKIKALEEESKKEILELKQFLDFKDLASFFHINHRQMKMVKEHKENFEKNFKKDNGEAIIELLTEAKLNNNLILEKVNKIKLQREEISHYEKNLKEDETQKVDSKIKEVLIKIEEIKIENVKGEKRNEKFKETKEELINSLKQILSKMNVEIV